MLILLLTYNEGKRKTAAMLPCLNGNKNVPSPWLAWFENLLPVSDHGLAAWYLAMV